MSGARVLQMIIRIGGLIALALGAAFWAGRGLRFVGIHMLVGLIVVIALWAIAIVNARQGGGVGATLTGIVVGLVLLGVGLTQRSLLPGAEHWIIQVIHLLVALLAIGSGEMIGGSIAKAKRRF